MIPAKWSGVAAAALEYAQAQPRQVKGAERFGTTRFGVNLSGAEAHGSDALRPRLSDFKDAIDRQRFDLVRYPFKRDRMSANRIRELGVLIGYAKSRGVPVILDNHSYAWRSVEDQTAWWTSFAKNFSPDGSVLLDLNNEPKGVSWMPWATDAKRIIANLRRNGIRHPILLEWPRFSSIGRFDKNETSSEPCNSAACALDRTPGPLDPLDQTYLNGHRYFDADGSGTTSSCAKRDGTVRTESGFSVFAAQLRKRHMKGYVTETAFGSHAGIPQSCRAVGADAVADLRANGDVLLGVTWWGGGRLWPDRYAFKIDCSKTDSQTCAASEYLRAIRP